MKILTGMQASGDPHIGNYFGMMKRAIELQNNPDNECFYFIADLHSFTTKRDPKIFKQNLNNCVLDWLALGIDPKKSVFYRQSDIAFHTELLWYLSCITPMGLLKRSHSFKDKKSQGLEANTGLFIYPILMAADILLYDAQKVPVGKDQKQHIEIARDLAQKFNNQYGEIFVLPEAEINPNVEVIPGLDGQKMSKSYGNTIEIFADEKILKKKIMSIKTESITLGTPIDPDKCNIFYFHKLFGNPSLNDLEKKYKEGKIGFGDSKKILFELIWDYFSESRKKREKIAQDKTWVEKILGKGAEKAKAISEKKLKLVRKKLGL